VSSTFLSFARRLGFLGLATAALAGLAAPARAQLGSGWVQYWPTKVVHLGDESGLRAFPWAPSRSVCTPACADYHYDGATDTEIFRVLDHRSNRAEIRLQNDYATGRRQIEGYVTFYAPLNDLSLMQIWGSVSGAMQLMLRGYTEGGGSIRADGVTLGGALYGVETRVNVIHLQEDSGNKIQIYLNGAKAAEIADNEAVTNYHKYGCYGPFTTGPAVVRWRQVRSFRDGAPPAGSPGDMVVIGSR
jgi:hypothetical protein